MQEANKKLFADVQEAPTAENQKLLANLQKWYFLY